MQAKKFLLIGNDKKVQECKSRLISKGFCAEIESGKDLLQKLRYFDCIVLPLPTISNGYVSGTEFTLRDILNNRRNDQYIFCGNIDLTEDYNCYSYYYNESFLIKNSQLTAQSVLKLILECVDYSLSGVNVAVIGYGRCGKMISKVLNGIGMDVTVFSRRAESMTQASFDGFLTENTVCINKVINGYSVIVNTVPSNIITDEGIKKLSSENVYIEVASKPYGFNINDTDIYNFKYILGESLPGRFTPKSAGINIADTVIEILKEV